MYGAFLTDLERFANGCCPLSSTGSGGGSSGFENASEEAMLGVLYRIGSPDRCDFCREAIGYEGEWSKEETAAV